MLIVVEVKARGRKERKYDKVVGCRNRNLTRVVWVHCWHTMPVTYNGMKRLS